MLGKSSSLLLFGIALLLTSTATAELRYQPAVGTTHAYRVEITADLPDAKDTLKGVIVYTVKRQADNGIKVEYRGGLTRNRQTKAASRTRGPGGPRGIRRPGGGPPRGPRDPFSTPTFKGLTGTTNQLTIDQTGHVLAMEGNSQLPYLLGNLSTLIFEPLPENPQNAWEISNGVSISEANERQSFRRPGPPRPGFGSSNNEPARRTSGTEKSAYKIVKSENDLTTVEKTYALNQPLTDGKAFELAGKGTWIFDEAIGFPKQLDFRQDLTVNLNNVSIKLPMTCKYERLTEAELAAHREAQEKKQAEMKARLADAQKAAQTRRQTPLTAEQKADVLKKLGSANMSDIRRGMLTLQFKDPQEPDAEIAAALKKLLTHNNRGIQMRAQQIHKKWGKTE